MGIEFRSRCNGLFAATWLVCGTILCAVPRSSVSETFVWVDDEGLTHFTDDRDALPDALFAAEESLGVDHLRALWNGVRTGPVPETPPGASGRPEDRIVRMLLGAIADMERGESARAEAALKSAVRLAPRSAEPHWYLADLARRRGRYATASQEFETFIALAGPHLNHWKQVAARERRELAAERKLADESIARPPLLWVEEQSDDFKIQLDAELEAVSPDWPRTAMAFLQDARREVAELMGLEPLEPLGVMFYGRAAYSQAHAHRFSFRTVGFFDGQIHVAAPAHPSDELRSLLFHEYTHALFREQTGGDRPYWLNEGLAEQVERRALGSPASTRSERAALRSRIAAGRWIPLRRLAQSFSGLNNEEARAAYLQSVVTVEWITGHTDLKARANLLRGLGVGRSADLMLYETFGFDTDGLDATVREHVLSEFPAVGEVADLGG
ncbi:MAG: hypothetical protein CBC48_04300 [bacterium TMED88]|nr:hypothetical protein [Deltaproteobacteria bacterium]OUV35213.1 MAG: hypothetical protein CBC48_04300 [bacterium TMED88]